MLCVRAARGPTTWKGIQAELKASNKLIGAIQSRVGASFVARSNTSVAVARTPINEQSPARGYAAKQKLTPAQKSLREKQQHAKLVEEVMNKLDEPEYSYVNKGQRDGIRNHTNLVIVLHMVIDDNKEFKKRLDTWCSWNHGTPGVFETKKTEAEKQAEKEKKDAEDAAAAAAVEAESKETTPAKPAAAKPAPPPPKAAPKEEEEDSDEPILPDEDKKSSGKFELKSFLKEAGIPAKSVDDIAKKLNAAGFGVDVFPDVNDSWLKKAGLTVAAERGQVLKQVFAYLAENPVD